MDLQKVLREIGTELLEQIDDRRLADAIAELAETQPDRSAIAKAVIPGIVEAIVETALEKTEPTKPVLSAEADEPLIIGGAEFVPVYSDMCDYEFVDEDIAHWGVKVDDDFYYSLYCHKSDDHHLFILNVDTSELYWDGKLFEVQFTSDGSDPAQIFLGDTQYSSIDEMIKDLS
jgi:hypothetical protein